MRSAGYAVPCPRWPLAAVLLCSGPWTVHAAARPSAPAVGPALGPALGDSARLPGALAAARWIAGAADAATAAGTNWSPDRGTLAPRGPFPLLRKAFTTPPGRRVRRATLLATALGSYQLTLNGVPVGPDVLAPSWTDYRKRVEYQTYDVTRLLHSGTNVLGAVLGEGWYGSTIGVMTNNPYAYGPPPLRLLCALQITYADGRTAGVVSDSSWRSTPGPVLMSQIYAGETYDARRWPAGWDRPGFDDHSWELAREYDPPSGVIVVPRRVQRTERVGSLAPVRRIPVGPDTTVYDLGQNMVGWTRLRVWGRSGDTVRVRHAEVLASDGKHIDVGNLFAAAQTDTYILAGRGEERHEPHFTYHGFRYVEVVAPRTVRVKEVRGVVIHTNAPETATFTSSDTLVNRLWRNIQWSLRGNLMSVPTDCPQRSERLGWTGDAQAFWPTATYLMDLRAFTRKWMADLRDTQSEIPSGCFPMVSPHPYPIGDIPDCGGPGWSDAGVLVPYAAYRQYGDTAAVREHWGAMERYMKFVATENTSGTAAYRWTVNSGGWGDWYPADRSEKTSQELLATTLWAADALAMRDMAHALGDREAEARYATLYDRIRAAFQQAYVHADGFVGEGERANDRRGDSLVAGGTVSYSGSSSPQNARTSQTSYALALRYGLVPDSIRPAAVRRLADDIAEHGHLATGFIGTPRLLPVLSEQGRDDLAYDLLLVRSAPSWLYMVDHGATTMWEQWKDPLSFNHYAYGCVGEWLFRYVAGITQDTASVGFRHIVIRPHPDPKGRVTHVRASYASLVGTIVSGWTVNPATGAVVLDVTIPSGTTARVDVPVRNGTGYRYVSHTVSGGTYHFAGA